MGLAHSRWTDQLKGFTVCDQAAGGQLLNMSRIDRGRGFEINDSSVRTYGKRANRNAISISRSSLQTTSVSQSYVRASHRFISRLVGSFSSVLR